MAFLIGNLNKEHGGAQRLLYDICRSLPKDDFDLTVYYCFGEGTFASDFESTGVSVVGLDASSNFDARTFVELTKELRAAEYDILQTNSPISGVWGRLAGTAASVPSIVSVEHNVHHSYRPLARYANGLSLPLADVVVGVSQSVTDSILDWERWLLEDSSVETIHNGVDVEAIEATFGRCEQVVKDQTGLDSDDVIVGSFGRFAEQKGFEYLLRSFAIVRDAIPEATLLLIGDGPQRQHLESLSSDLGLEDAVVFPGRVPEIYPLLPAFDVAVFPSLWEGLPLAPAETMAARLPIIASDIPPFRELVDDAGVLIPPKDVDSFADETIALLKDDVARTDLGRRAYDRVSEKFSISRTVSEYEQLYRRLALSTF